MKFLTKIDNKIVPCNVKTVGNKIVIEISGYTIDYIELGNTEILILDDTMTISGMYKIPGQSLSGEVFTLYSVKD